MSSAKSTIILPLDIIMIICALLVCILLFLRSFSGDFAAYQVEIKSEEGTYLYSLESNHELSLTGPLGITSILIANQEVQVLDSPGRQKICVKSGPISKNGQWLACLPNKIFIRIIGNERFSESQVDAITF